MLRSAPTSLWALAVIYLLVGGLWAVSLPPFEKPDEVHHFAYVQFVARERRLPVQTQEIEPFLEEELQQPPLYYAGLAVALRIARSVGLDETDLALWLPRPNPRFVGKAPSPDAEPNFWRHGHIDDLPDAWPPHDLLVPRLLTVVIGLAVVLITYCVGLLVLDGSHWLALGAAAVVALLPQFTFMSSSTTNGPLSWAISAAYLLLLLLLIDAPAEKTRRYFVLLGLVMGVALLTKATLFVLIPLIFLARPRALTWRQWLSGLVTWALLAAAIGGWWFLRNTVLYGDSLGRQEVINPDHYRWNLAPKSLASPYFRGPFWIQVARSFIGSFGFANLGMPTPIYAVAGLTALMAVAGLVRRACHLACTLDLSDSRIQASRLVVLVALPLLSLSGLVYYNLSVSQPQGRYLFQALPALAVLFVLGLSELTESVSGLLRPRDSEFDQGLDWRKALAIGLAGAMLVLNLYALMAVALPPYGEAAWALLRR